MVTTSSAELVRRVLDEIQEKAAKALAKAATLNDKEMTVQAMAFMALTDQFRNSLLQSNWEDVFDTGRAGIEMLDQAYGPYAKWDTQTRDAFGYHLAFWHYGQAISLAVQENHSQCRAALSKAKGIYECTGALKRAVDDLEEDQSPERRQVSKYVGRTESAFQRQDFFEAIALATKGITYIEEQQRMKPHWVGNELVHLYERRGRSQAVIGINQKNKDMAKKALADLRKAVSFPDSYYLSPGFREEAQDNVRHLERIVRQLR